MSLHHDSGQGIGEPTADSYEVDSAVYEPLLNVLSSRTPAGSHEHNSDPKTTRFFSNDAVHLRLPGKRRSKGGSRFLTAVVEYFAKDAGADLITFGLDDVDDLGEHFSILGPKQEEEDAHRHSSMDRYLEELYDDPEIHEDMDNENTEV